MTKTVGKASVLAASFLIAGTCIGGGMLALPVETGVAGFIPSTVIMILAWLFMTMTGLLVIEANLWMEEGAHIMTMATRLLGLPGKVISAILFIFMGYGSLVAYNTGGASLLSHACQVLFDLSVTQSQACVLFGTVFGLLFFVGAKSIGRINTILILGMGVAYMGIVSSGLTKPSVANLSHADWSVSSFSFPLLLATFSYQMIIPSLTPYLKRDPSSLRWALILGTTMPFLAYLVWQFIVLGVVPVADLTVALEEGKAATEPLRNAVKTSYLPVFGEYFSFFAITTSYLGIGLATFDFIVDACRVKKNSFGKTLVGFFIIVPCITLAIYFPNAFIYALEITGGFGDSILNGILPVMMVWMGRYHKKIEGPYQVLGGRKMLSLLWIFAFFVFIIQIVILMKH